jgi:hypothetical protein
MGSLLHLPSLSLILSHRSDSERALALLPVPARAPGPFEHREGERLAAAGLPVLGDLTDGETPTKTISTAPRASTAQTFL